MKKKLLALMCILTMSVVLLAGCGGSDDPTSKDTDDGTDAQVVETEDSKDDEDGGETEGSDFTEAEQLAELVSTGSLPPVEERLPNPEDIMVEVKDSIGNYGESFNFSFEGKGSQWFYGKLTEEPLFRFKTDGTVEPNVAKGFDINADASMYTIYLREGMKWSDGEDFTSDDVIFFYEEMCKKETFGKSLWDCFKSLDEEGNESIAVFDKVDDYTFTVTFENPEPTFLENLAINGKWCFAPAHWYENVLPDIIGEEEAEKKATEMGYADVPSMGKETGYYYWNIAGRPTLRPWVVFEDVDHNDPDGDYFVMRRNPYFWKTDEEGKQLPYIDELRFTRISDPQQSLLKILDGSTHIGAVGYADYDVLIENQAAGGYELLEWQGTAWGSMDSQLHLNQTVKDENLRELFQNVDFRQALSIAVDRDEYTEILSDGFAGGAQAAPAEGALGYSEEWYNKWTEYNPEKAKELLESCGLVMNSDGFYEFADGSKLVLNMSTFTDSGADKSAELLMKYFGEVGIDTTYKPVDRTVLDNMTTSNDHEAIIGPVTPAGGISIVLRPDTLVPVRNYAAWYGAVGDWYASGGTEGVAPTGDLLKLVELYDQMKMAITPEDQLAIADEMLKLHEENIWVIAYMEALPTLIAKNANIKNFPEVSIFADEFRDFGIAHLHTCYFAE